MPHSRRFEGTGRSWRRSLPISLRGSAATTVTPAGTLYGAMRSRHQSRERSPRRRRRPARSRRYAHGTSPSRSSATPATAASRDAGILAEVLLDLVGEHLQPAAVDHRAHAPVDPHEAVVVDPGEVAGAQPAVVGEPVAEMRTRRPARSPSADRTCELVVAHSHFDAGVRAGRPRRASPRRTASSRPRSNRPPRRRARSGRSR